MSTLVLFFNMRSWEGDYTNYVEPGYSHVPSYVFNSVRVLLNLYVEVRAACHFPHIFWLGLDCVGHLYLELAAFFIPFYAVMLMVFPSPVLMSDRQVDFRNNLHLLSYAVPFPSRPSLRKSSIIKELFSLWIYRFAVFSSRTRLYSQSNFRVFEIQVLVMQLLRIG